MTPDPLAFPRELARCLAVNAINSGELARRMLAGLQAQSLVQFRKLPDAFPDDLAWLTDCINQLLGNQDWPIDIPADVFIPAAANFLRRALLVEWRLTSAAALDVLRGR